MSTWRSSAQGRAGLRRRVAAKRAGLSAVLFDRGPDRQRDRAVSDVHDVLLHGASGCRSAGCRSSWRREKPSRRDALAYYRAVASHFDSRCGSTRWSRHHRGGECWRTRRVRGGGGGRGDGTEPQRLYRRARGRRGGEAQQRGAVRGEVGDACGEGAVTFAHAVCVATGYFGRPNRLGVPGEDLPHVRMATPKGTTRGSEPVVIVGGGNSAVDAALECARAGAKVHDGALRRGPRHDVKPWVRPDDCRIACTRELSRAHFQSRVTAIDGGACRDRGAGGRAASCRRRRCTC